MSSNDELELKENSLHRHDCIVSFLAGAKWMQEQDEWIELKNEPNEVPEMDCYFYNETVGVVFIPKDEYVKIGLYTHYCPVTLPSPPKTK